ncbi:MAG: Usg family protein [Rhizobiales bacterium]|nr:Usg family protein [Hyphomicrobiales bacterium]
MTKLERQLAGYRLTTAEIDYWRPDHPNLLQQFIWQQLDLAPEFPVLTKFLKFWDNELEGRLHRVTVASAGLLTPAQFRWADHCLHIH